MKRIGQKDVLEDPLLDIDLCEQHKIMVYLDTIRAKAEKLKRQQHAIQSELEKAIPSVLFKAFRGEL